MWNTPRAPFSAPDQGAECIVALKEIPILLRTPLPWGEPGQWASTRSSGFGIGERRNGYALLFSF